MKIPRGLLLPFILVLSLPSPAPGQIVVHRQVLASGGGRVADADHVLLSAVGQPVVGQVVGSHLLQSGYFYLPGTGLLPVFMAGFVVERSGPAALLRWEISGEVDHAGFHVWRQATDTRKVRLTWELIRGGPAFAFVDAAPPAGELEYWLESVAADGRSEWFGPARLAAVPLVFQLGRNRPNPFNPCTTLTYSLPSTQRVRLRLYDLRGMLVRVLVDGEQPTGTHTVVWDGQDQEGAAAASGTYLAQLQAESGVRTCKLVLAR